MKHYIYFGKNHLLSLPLLIVYCLSPVWRRIRHLIISPELWTKERAKKTKKYVLSKLILIIISPIKNNHKNTHCKINRRL